MNLNEVLTDKHITQRLYQKPRMTDEGGYYWFKGETVKLTFDVFGDVKNDLDNTYVDAAKFMEDKDVTVTMYDYMGRVIRDWYIERPGTTIDVLIENNEESNDFFARDISTGTYQLSITAHNTIGMSLEIVNRLSCVLEVR
jgi:hypothetical protein